MVRIRLKRIGQRNRPHYRIVVTESTRSRDGKYIESLGHYNPRDKVLVIDRERAAYWLAHGAQPSDTAGRLLRRFDRMNTPPIAAAEPVPPAVPAPTEPAPAETAPAAPPPVEPETTTAASHGGPDETTG